MIAKKGNVLITGSSSGLGFHLADIYIRHGYNVFINGSTVKKLEKAKKILSVEGAVCDVTNEEDCKNLIRDCKKTIGNIDILICNVGSGNSVQVGKESLKEWKRIFDINLFSTINTINALMASTKAKKTSIICISSICGHEHIPGAPATYSVAKSALNSYIKSYSKFLITKGVSLNGIVCGNIMFEGSTWDKKLKNKKTTTKIALQDVPASKFASPMEIYKAANFLADDDSYICGSLIVVDGGQTRSI